WRATRWRWWSRFRSPCPPSRCAGWPRAARPAAARRPEARSPENSLGTPAHGWCREEPHMPRYIEGDFLPPKGRFAICVARFNAFITEELVKGAVDTLVRHGVADGDIDVFRCPGTYELPALTRRVAETRSYVGIITLGAVIRGGTPHFDYVAGECAKG